MRKTLLLTLLVSMTVSMLFASTAVSADGIGRIPTVTRLVKRFLDLEDKLIHAVEKRDTRTASDLLSDDFEMRVGAMPGNPIPRASWLQQSFAEPKFSSTIEQMAAHDFGEVEVVSYSWKIKMTKSAEEREFFIVDVWTRGTGDWKLAVRYADPVEEGVPSIPGAAMATPAFEKKE